MKLHYKSIFEDNTLTRENSECSSLNDHYITLKVLSLLLLKFFVAINDDSAKITNLHKAIDEDFLLRAVSAMLGVLVSLCESASQFKDSASHRLRYINVLSCGFFWFSSILAFATSVLKRLESTSTLILISPLSNFYDCVGQKVKLVWLHCCQNLMVLFQDEITSKTCLMLCLSMIRCSISLSLTYQEIKGRSNHTERNPDHIDTILGGIDDNMLMQIDMENLDTSRRNRSIAEDETEKICSFLITLLDQSKVCGRSRRFECAMIFFCVSIYLVKLTQITLHIAFINICNSYTQLQLS